MRAFIAVDIPDDIKVRLLAAAADLPGDGIVPVKKEAMHITLHFLGELDAKGVASAKEALQCLETRPFEAALAGVSCFNPDFIKIVFAKVSQGAETFSAAYASLAEELSGRGLALEGRAYTPHATLARVKYVADRDALLGAISRLDGTGFGSFHVGSMALKESVLTRQGPVYNTLYELQL
jgi:2'-5' RNA ligase